MPTPTRFDIELTGSLWTLSRDGEVQGEYSQVARASHDAVARARELNDTGTPAAVYVHANDKVVEIDIDPEPVNPDIDHGAKDFLPSTPL